MTGHWEHVIQQFNNFPLQLTPGSLIPQTSYLKPTELPIYLTDFNYLKQFGVPVVAGRAFSEQYSADTVESMMINETALRKLGFNTAEEAIGVHVDMYPNEAKIVGVFKDFHFESLQKAIEPLAMRVMPSKFRLISVEMNTANVQQTISQFEKAW